MKKLTTLPLLALALLAAPAFATHPNEVCHVTLDLEALTKAAGATVGPAKVRFVFRTTLTDLNPPKTETVERPEKGPWIYKTDVHSSLYERRLAAVVIESTRYQMETGEPVWGTKVERPSEDTLKADAPIRCEVYAD